ncbi:hypothetical protein LshimejAT787_0700490 [Lyophyllum shimeji]|uniref:MARVEL domain-containing protein n=1 Tax=Lyophyllum shimeji TaxID=47721 RepID=A0A9P3PQ74_LYOSH|nr:hypothetical protein LshimejAT787_0700490 [Lyophyllum shimeji]
MVLEKATKSKAFTAPIIRRNLYILVWALVFAIAASELGLVSHQLHRGGNADEHYGSREFKHALGLGLFSCLLTFLMCLGHPWGPVQLMVFWALVAAVFWGTVAGVVYSSCPYRQNNCKAKDPYHTFHGSKWSEPQYFRECSRIVAIQGLAWAEWALFTIMFFAMLFDSVEFRPKPTKSFYGHITIPRFPFPNGAST